MLNSVGLQINNLKFKDKIYETLLKAVKNPDQHAFLLVSYGM